MEKSDMESMLKVLGSKRQKVFLSAIILGIMLMVGFETTSLLYN